MVSHPFHTNYDGVLAYSRLGLIHLLLLLLTLFFDFLFSFN